MRILHLAHRAPFPPNKGDKIRTFHILAHLAREHEVHLATLVDDARDMEVLADLEKLAASLSHARVDGALRKLFATRGLLQSSPITVRFFHHKALQRAVDELLAELDFDAVVCSSSPMAEYLFRSRHWGHGLEGMPMIMDLIDVDSFKWRQYADRKAHPWRWIYRHEARHLAAYERRIYREFTSLLLVSERETEYFPGGDPEDKIIAIPNGVDLEFFSPRHQARPAGEGPTLVFTGMMDYWPNIEGMSWFLTEVLPGICAKLPDVRLYIVGGRPSPEVLKWDNLPGVTVTGFVDDIRDYLGAADVCIVPLRIARGIQNKVLEAMAMGKAIVSTPNALEGIVATPGVHALSAADAGEFTDSVVALLRDPARAAALGAAARQLTETRYAWRENLMLLDNLLHDVAARRPHISPTAHDEKLDDSLAY